MTACRPLVIAHRGGAPDEIENSAAAFEHALALGVDAIECDVRQTADGALILLHDGAILVGDRRVRVQETGFADLKDRLPWLLTFEEFLDRFGARARMVVDLKATGFEEAVRVDLERRGLMDRTLVSTVHTTSLRHFAGRSPRPTLGLSRGHLVSSMPLPVLRKAARIWLRLSLPPLLLATLRVAGADAAMLQHHLVDRSLVAFLHRHGYRVFAWTVDSEAEALRIAQAGADGIASNVPARILAALNRRCV